MISIGDRLRLNDRGPVLFAEEHGFEAQVKCSWMDPMGQWHQGHFRSADLHKFEEVEAASGGSAGSRWSAMMNRLNSLVALW